MSPKRQSREAKSKAMLLDLEGERMKLKKRPSEYFKQNFMITTSGMNWNPTLKFCIEVLSADNIMWAIDYPYQTSPDSVKFMNDAPISDADKAKIFHKNAE